MSAAIQSVRTIRNAALESGLSMREQSPPGRDEMRRYETVSESIESLITPLTARQMHAINLLSMGKTVVATARSLDIGVSTLHRWKATHPLFKAELAQRQHNLFDAMIQKLRLTMSKAVDNLFEMMNSDMKSERKEVTHAMLKLLRPQKFLVPSESMSAQAVLDEAVREMRASRGESIAEAITEEERIAAIPSEFRVKEEVEHQGHGGHEGNAGTEECAKRPELRESTPLPSREGPGEGAASDEVDLAGDGVGVAPTALPRIADRSKPTEMNSEKLANASHAQLTPNSVTASRPLPQPLPQGEGSQSAARADQSVTASSECTREHLGQILREYAQDDGVGDKRAHNEKQGAK